MNAGDNPSQLSEQLNTLLSKRNIKAGFKLLDEVFGQDQLLDPCTPDAAAMLLTLAQWTDLGYRDSAFLQRHVACFSGIDRLEISLLRFLELKTVDAFCLLEERRYSEAAAILAANLHVSEDLMPGRLIFVTRFWKSRAHRREGKFDQAMEEICAARQCAESTADLELVAVTKIHESWLLFHRGERRLALQLLDEAEKTLEHSGHALSLANIAAARGRFIRSVGNYPEALLHFEKAIKIYKHDHSNHPNYARALVNAAYVKRLMALELRPKWRRVPIKGATHIAASKITREAMELLRLAGTIYAKHQHEPGTASVLVNMGHLQLEHGEIDQAEADARVAYDLGKTKDNLVWMARARILQAYAALAYSEEQLESVGVPHAQKAVDFANHALTLATRTQNRRLLAAAYITRGLAAADEHYSDWELAKDHAIKAEHLLGDEERDHLYRELGALKTKIMQSVSVNEIVRLWSNGELGGKSFQQVEEEFAEIVIPKVWANLGRNVSLVARELNISPKKVRRILKKGHYISS